MNKMNLTLKEYIDKVNKGELIPENVMDYYIKKAKSKNGELLSYIRFHEDYAQNHIHEFKHKALKGAPIAIKDIILTKGYISSCGSKMLEDFVSPYSATCFKNLENAGGLMIGKANMDEYAMGGSSRTSYFGMPKNPYGTDRIPGGSSGGSAAAVAADMCIAALGTDTGGSIRQPSSLCGIVGLKPTYGRVSRFGVQAMTSSLDQVGPMTKTVEDNLILLEAIAGYDDNDSNSVKIDDYQKMHEALNTKDLKKFKIALPKQYFDEGLDPKVKEVILNAVEKAKQLGATVEWVDFPLLKYALAVYYITVFAESSTNLARFDGIRFGLQEDTFDYNTIYEYYAKMRAKGFGNEVKRRIILGTYVLSAGYYDAYYLRAQRVRRKLKMEFDKLFKNYDLILGPVSPTVAWKLDDKADDPLANYLADIYTITINLVGVPAMSLPVGFAKDRGENLPVGLHIIADQRNEHKIYGLASVLEKALNISKK